MKNSPIIQDGVSSVRNVDVPSGRTRGRMDESTPAAVENASTSEAVKLWRDKFKLNLSASWKHDVEITVKDIELWKSILKNWFWIDAKGRKHRKAPGIKQLLTEYERLALDKTQSDNKAPTFSARSRERLPERSDSNLSSVRVEPPSQYFRVSRLVR